MSFAIALAVAPLLFLWWYTARGRGRFFDERMIVHANRRWLADREEAEEAYFTFSSRSKIPHGERRKRELDFEREFEGFLQDNWMKQRQPG